MRLTSSTAYLGTLLFFTLLACQPSDKGQDPSPVSTQSTAQTGPYLFTGNPGIRTSSLADITGTLTGTIDGQPIAFGPDKAFPVQARGGYNSYTQKASVLSIQANSGQYGISLFFNGPFEAGRNYRIYNADNDTYGDDKFAPYIATPFIRIPEGQTGRDIIGLATPDEQVRITDITPEYMDIELLFTLKKPGAVQERITLRIKNVIDANRSLRTQSEGEPFWDYTNVDRTVDVWGYLPRQGNVPSVPTTTQVRISQPQLTTPVSDINYEGKTEPATSQSSSLYQVKNPQEQIYVECSFGTTETAAGYKRVDIIWPFFRGVGSYVGDQIKIGFSYSQGQAGFWRVQPDRLASASTKWQVDVQRVTPNFIEGTYTIVEAPIVQKNGSIALPTLVSVSGRFKVIYPR